MSLPNAAAALERGDQSAALGLVLESWALCKHPRIAAVIEELSQRVAKTRSPPGGNKLADKQAAWLRMKMNGEAGDLEHLLATLTDIKRQAELSERLTSLVGVFDPRVATAMHRLLEHPPIPGWTGRHAVRQALEIVASVGDPRSAAALEHIATINAEGGGSATHVLRELLPRTQGLLRAEVPVLTSEQSYMLGQIEAHLAQVVRRDPAELFAAVYANPDDDDPRAVLADALQEAGDPRGEFIALQLARGRGGKKTRRESELLKAHGRDWLGAIAPALPKDGIVFERGFLAKCRTINSRGLSGAVAICEAVEWATVEELTLGPWQFVPELLPSLRALRVLTTEGNAGELRSHAKLEKLHIKFIYAPDYRQGEHLATLAFPSLREFWVSWCYSPLGDLVAFLKATPTLKRLHISTGDLAAMTPWLVEHGIELV